MRLYAVFTLGEQLSASALNEGMQLFDRQAFLCRKLRHGDRNIQNVFAFEVPAAADVEIAAEHLRISFSENGFNLVRSPDKELAFFALAVGILSRIETPVRIYHLTADIIENFLCNSAIQRVARLLERVQVDATEQGIVVQHLLEMWH